MGFQFIGQSPRTKSKYDLRLQGAQDRGAMARTQVGEAGADRRAVVKEQGVDKRAKASAYASAMLADDEKDFKLGIETYKGFSNMTTPQQESFTQKPEAYGPAKKMFKRLGLDVFDDKGELIFPPSKADADIAIKSAIEKLKEDQRRNRKPNSMEASDMVSKLNASRTTLGYMVTNYAKGSPEAQGIEAEIKAANKLIKFYTEYIQTETSKLGSEYAPKDADAWLDNAGF